MFLSSGRGLTKTGNQLHLATMTIYYYYYYFIIIIFFCTSCQEIQVTPPPSRLHPGIQNIYLFLYDVQSNKVFLRMENIRLEILVPPPTHPEIFLAMPLTNKLPCHCRQQLELNLSSNFKDRKLNILTLHHGPRHSQ